MGERIWVRPPWGEPRPGAIDLVIDPGQAFGTGSHPTTQLSLELLLELEPEGSFADLGCGSGVLAIAAAKLGFGPVSAIDHDPAALEATRDNAAANGVALDRIERRDLRREPPPPAQTVVANLMRPLLLRLAERLESPPRAADRVRPARRGGGRGGGGVRATARTPPPVVAWLERNAPDPALELVAPVLQGGPPPVLMY